MSECFTKKKFIQWCIYIKKLDTKMSPLDVNPAKVIMKMQYIHFSFVPKEM